MVKKYWKEILAFFLSLVIVIFLRQNGEEYFDEEILPFVFSIFGTIAILLGLRLFIWVRGDILIDEIMKEKTTEAKPTEEELREQKKWAGKLEIENEELSFKYGETEQIKINISDIKAIGELTTDADPVTTDWYLVIVKNNNQIVYLPVYAVGLQETLKELSKILNHEIVPKLFASTKFDSNVIYPKSIDGNKLFHLKGLNPDGVWKKVKVKLGISPITPVLTEEIVELKN